eukprot:scaffold103821_cov18-Tisochrysis_lutea.AAC.1
MPLKGKDSKPGPSPALIDTFHSILSLHRSTECLPTAPCHAHGRRSVSEPAHQCSVFQQSFPHF